MTSIDESYRLCRKVASNAGSSFYWSFRLLPADQQKAMCALYAFSRRADDLVDDEECSLPERRVAIAEWRQALENALSDQYSDPLLPALVDTIRRYDIPSNYLFELVEGVKMDLDKDRYQTFEELQLYCYRVASVIGLACVHVWGFCGDETLQRASTCGLAFQLTNILRDLKEDAQRGRIYLPLDELQRFDYSPDQLLRGERTASYNDLMRFQLERADALYREAALTEGDLRPAGRRIFRMMFDTYRGLLEEIKSCGGDVFNNRIRLGTRRRMSIALRHLLFARSL